jgi:hypothetical protein
MCCVYDAFSPSFYSHTHSIISFAVDQICNDMDLGYFCLALQTAGLDGRLHGNGGKEYIVFVPNHNAMQQAGVPLDDIDYLQDLLLFQTDQRRVAVCCR